MDGCATISPTSAAAIGDGGGKYLLVGPDRTSEKVNGVDEVACQHRPSVRPFTASPGSRPRAARQRREDPGRSQVQPLPASLNSRHRRRTGDRLRRRRDGGLAGAITEVSAGQSPDQVLLTVPRRIAEVAQQLRVYPATRSATPLNDGPLLIRVTFTFLRSGPRSAGRRRWDTPSDSNPVLTPDRFLR